MKKIRQQHNIQDVYGVKEVPTQDVNALKLKGDYNKPKGEKPKKIRKYCDSDNEESTQTNELYDANETATDFESIKELVLNDTEKKHIDDYVLPPYTPQNAKVDFGKNVVNQGLPQQYQRRHR